MRVPLPRCCSAKCLFTSVYAPHLRTVGNPNPETRRSSRNTKNAALYRSAGQYLRIRILHCWYDGNILVIVTSTRHTPSKLCTLIPRFSWLRNSRSLKFMGSTQEHIYITQTVQWVGASELFDNLNRSSSHTAWRSRTWREKEQLSITMFLQIKNTKNTKTFFGCGQFNLRIFAFAWCTGT
jgi:hypothetical protein